MALTENLMSTALLLGLIWSGLWMAFLYVIMKCFPWEMLHDYPEDVRRASTLPEPTRKQKRNAKIFGGIGSIIIFGALIVFGLFRFRTERPGFMTLFWFLFIIAMSWNVVDLLVMDWLLVCTVRPAWLIMTVALKNTEEKWLLELYGQEYTEYKQRVNRCIPWIPKR